MKVLNKYVSIHSMAYTCMYAILQILLITFHTCILFIHTQWRSILFSSIEGVARLSTIFISSIAYDIEHFIHSLVYFIMGSTINKTLLHCEDANAPNSSANDELSEIDPDKYLKYDLSKNCNYYNQAEFNATFSANRNFSIIHANIRSSEANLKELSYYLNDLNVEFTFIILSETWATNQNTDMHSKP